jgi:hypothetical protein
MLEKPRHEIERTDPKKHEERADLIEQEHARFDAQKSEDDRLPSEIVADIHERRADLLEDLAELEDILRAKLDVRARVERWLRRGRERGLGAIESMLEMVRENPVPVLTAGVILLLGAVWLRRR